MHVYKQVRGVLDFNCEDDILKKSAKNNHRNSKGNSDNENYNETIVISNSFAETAGEVFKTTLLSCLNIVHHKNVSLVLNTNVFL